MLPKKWGRKPLQSDRRVFWHESVFSLAPHCLSTYLETLLIKWLRMPHVTITLIAIIVTSVLFSGKGNGIEMRPRASLFLGDEPNFLLSLSSAFSLA